MYASIWEANYLIAKFIEAFIIESAQNKKKITNL